MVSKDLCTVCFCSILSHKGGGDELAIGKDMGIEEWFLTFVGRFGSFMSGLVVYICGTRFIMKVRNIRTKWPYAIFIQIILPYVPFSN